ncbi:hypothetical protein BpHYR1_038502 [Brachionus plicatilis]|uniref:Uncharacterized protein n=1 Tax=Brachionus plicatilis TaxID=10195 RepID=A0A3M7PQ27_BRAPC|nr:hypothetical protein BpHYR1_038502 [Brachionus plicatilis]
MFLWQSRYACKTITFENLVLVTISVKSLSQNPPILVMMIVFQQFCEGKKPTSWNVGQSPKKNAQL